MNHRVSLLKDQNNIEQDDNCTMSHLLSNNSWDKYLSGISNQDCRFCLVACIPIANAQINKVVLRSMNTCGNISYYR